MSTSPEKISQQELWGAGLMAFASFFLYFGYEMLRSSTSSLFNQAFGVENLPYALAVTPVMLLGMIWFYGRCLSALGPKNTLIFTTLLSAFVFCISFLILHSGNRWGAGFLYIYKEAYIVVIIEQYWSFINSRLSVASAKKLSGPIIGISTTGGIIGGFILKTYAVEFGSASMFLGAAILMLPSALLSALAFKKGGAPRPSNHVSQKDTASDSIGLNLFRSYPALAALFVIVVLSQIVATGLQLRFQTSLQGAYPHPDEQTAFSGSFHMALNASCIFFQFVITPLALRFIKTTWIQLFIPMVHLITGMVSFIFPTFFNISGAYLAFKSLDYSLFKASKEVFYIPFSFDIRYRAKQVVDSFGYRFGKGLCSTGLVLLKSLSAIHSTTYAWITIIGAGLWIILAWPVTQALNKASKRVI